MSSPGPHDLFDLCHEWLDACRDALATTSCGTPDCSYVSPGSPAFDCELLTVHAGGPAEADTAPLQPPLQPGHRPSTTGSVHLAQITATALRCAPVVTDDGQPPDPDSQEAAALCTTQDVWAIWNFTRHAYKEGLLFANPSSTRELFFDPAVPFLIQGGIAGWQIPIRVALYGYASTL